MSKLLTVLCALLVNSACVSANDGERYFIQGNFDEFAEYFDYTYVKAQTGELLLKLSPSFLSQFPDDCKLTATIAVLHYKGDPEKLFAIASLVMVRSDPKNAARSTLHVSELEVKMIVSFIYHIDACGSGEARQPDVTQNFEFALDSEMLARPDPDPKEQVE